MRGPKSSKDFPLHFSQIRFLENKIRQIYPFVGTPIKLLFKKG